MLGSSADGPSGVGAGLHSSVCACCQNQRMQEYLLHMYKQLYVDREQNFIAVFTHTIQRLKTVNDVKVN